MLRKRVTFFVASLDNVKIAQCAVARNLLGQRIRFVDSIQILPGYERYWLQIMQSILPAMGPGDYCYGSIWNASARQDALTSMAGVKVTRAVSYLVHVVDFSQWTTWDAYAQDVSTNVRRNALKAQKNDPAVAITLRQGISALQDVFALARMRFSTAQRKGNIGDNRFIAMCRYAGRSLVLRQMAYTAKVIHHGRVAAYFAGVKFGLQTFYLDGASVPDNGGAAWLLMLRMLERAWQPNARVILGMYEPDKMWAGRENILLSRRHLRANELPSDIIWFRYDG
jgi:hypothetical protein